MTMMRRTLLPLAFAALLLPGAATAAPKCPQDAEGGACVWGRAEGYDGEALQLRGLTIHLLGITAPGRKDLCGKAEQPADCSAQARRRMGELVAKGGVACEILDIAAGDLLGRCRVAEGDLAALLAASGVVLAKDGPYAEATRQAMAAKRGLWGIDGSLPRDWESLRGKAEKRDPGEPR